MAVPLLRNQEDIRLNGTTFTVDYEPNKGSKDPVCEKIRTIANGSYGAFKITSLPGVAGNLVVETARLAGSPSTALAAKIPTQVFKKLAGGFIFGYAVMLTTKWVKEAKVVANDGSGRGNLPNLIKTSFAWVTATSYTLLNFIPGNSILKSAALVGDVGEDGTDMIQQAHELKLAGDLESVKGVSPDIKKALVQKKKAILIALVKAVIALTAGIFALMSFILGTALFPGIVSAALAALALSLTFTKIFHNINMDQRVNVERQVVKM